YRSGLVVGYPTETRIVGCAAAEGRHPSVLRSPRDEDARPQFRRERWRHLEPFHLVELTLVCHDLARQQSLDDQRVFLQPFVSLVVRRGVVERREIVLEAAGDQVEVEPPGVEMTERGEHLRDGIRV